MSVTSTSDAVLFVDHEGRPLHFFLPMSLASRNSFKEKIELNGGVIAQSELMPSIIKIGDPAKPQSYDASWLSFRYIDDTLREGALQNPEFYVMDDPVAPLHSARNADPTPTTQRETPLSGGLPNGVGSRGTRTEFTPAEDDILRRIVHRPGVATSGNKIYQLIAQHYGGHSFHSWRDRYIRHMRPIWGAPNDNTAMDVNATDEHILTQSYLRAPHLAERISRSSTPQPRLQQQQELRTPATPPALKKQRAAFSTTDDEILLRAIAEKGETASTYKALGHRHPHHTWESWKNRVKALKKKNSGTMPDPDQTLAFDISDISTSNLENLELSLAPSTASGKQSKASHVDDMESEQVNPNIDPNLQQLQLSMILDDEHQEAFEQQFSQQSQFDTTRDLIMQQQLQNEDQTASPFDFQQTTEDMLLQNLQESVSAVQTRHQPPSRRRSNLKASNALKTTRKRRQINIHDPTADENVGRVSDIEDGSTPTASKTMKGDLPKKRKTRAAAIAAAGRAAALTRTGHHLQTPSKFQVEPSDSNHKSPKSVRHESPGLVHDVAVDTLPEFAVELPEPKTRAARARATSTEAQPSSVPAMDVSDREWAAIQDNTEPAEAFIRIDTVLSEDDIRAEEQIRGALGAPNPRLTRSHQQTLDHIDDGNFVQPSSVRPSDLQAPPLRSSRKRARQEVRATPESSPVAPAISMLTGPHTSADDAYDAPSPTPASPSKSYSQSQFLQDTQAIRGELVDFDFDTTIHGFELGSQEQRHEEEIQMQAHQRKAHWVERQAKLHNITPTDAIDAWNRASGNQSIASKIVSAYGRGESPPRMPGVWTKADDEIIRSADVAAMEQVDRYHEASGGVESRLLFLEQLDELRL